MLTIKELRELNDSGIELNKKMDILNKTDYYDDYLIKLMQRFKEKNRF